MALTAESLEAFRQKMLADRDRPMVLQPDCLIVPPALKARWEYMEATVEVWRLAGAVRLLGPDGKTWINKLWRTANVNYGSGNRAKRRMGYTYEGDPFYDGHWVKR